MNRASTFLILAAALALAPLARARAESEIAPPEKRKVSLDKAELIAKQTKPAPLPANLVQPFAPPNFELTDAEEAAAALAAARAANPMAVIPTGPTDRQLLTEIASKVRPSGSSYFAGSPLLFFGNKVVKTGAHFTVLYKGTDYDLELTQIDGSNFTLRYKGEEITRPIKIGP